MKITIEPTDENQTPPYYPKVELTIPSDGLTLSDLIGSIKGVLIAWGYSSKLVEEHFEQEEV